MPVLKYNKIYDTRDAISVERSNPKMKMFIVSSAATGAGNIAPNCALCVYNKGGISASARDRS